MGTRKGISRPDRQVDCEPGDNAKFLKHGLDIQLWGDVQLSDPIAVAERSKMYLQKCIDDDVKPSIEEYALALGISRIALYQYREGIIGKNAEVLNTLKRTCNLINAQMVHYMQNGKINPVSGIFLMKNNMGYTDKQEVVVTPNNRLGEEIDQKKLEQKYIESIVSDDSDE